MNVAYANVDDDDYVSVSGRASISSDETLKKKLFNTIAKAWFPGGVDDPNLALLAVHIEEAEFWRAPRLQGGAAAQNGHQRSDGKSADRNQRASKTAGPLIATIAQIIWMAVQLAVRVIRGAALALRPASASCCCVVSDRTLAARRPGLAHPRDVGGTPHSRAGAPDARTRTPDAGRKH